MTTNLDHPLDHPIWWALTSRQRQLAIGDDVARRFPADVSPLAACIDDAPASVRALRDLIPENGNISIMQRAPPEPVEGVVVAFSGEGVQMVADGFKGAPMDGRMDELGEQDADEMLELATLTRPGPFVARTNQMGRFIGIRDQGRLVAMAGERMQLDGFSEISAVCTHPDYRGRGYGGALLAAVGARLLSEGITPFLHAYASNTGAIALYRRMGFTHRCNVRHEIWERRGGPDVGSSGQS